MIDLNRAHFRSAAVALALATINTERCTIALGDEELRGIRFRDDECVIAVLESQIREEAFMRDPIGTVGAALHEAASADFWYTYEKSYEMDECRVDDGEDE